MKIGKVFDKLAQDKRVKSISFMSDDSGCFVTLEDAYYGSEAGKRKKFCATAKQAEAFIKSAKKMPVAREGYRIVTNLMTGLPVEEAIGTPYSCSVASETYWSS